MAKNIPAASRILASAFIKAFPVTQQPPHTTLISADLDKFGISQGVYAATASAADLNASRNSMVSRLNNIGSSEVWAKGDPAFQVVVNGAIGEWTVKPSAVAVSHQSSKMPDRNVTTIANRAKKTDRLYTAVLADKSAKLTPTERKVLKDERDIVLNMAQLQADIGRLQGSVLEKTLTRLAKKDPGNRLL